MARHAASLMPALQAWHRRLNGGASEIAAWAGRQFALRAIGKTWNRLLDEACALIAPALGPMLRDDGLVAVPREGAGFDLHRVTRAGVTRMSMPEPGPKTVRKSVELRLRADQVLERSLSLPGASRDYLPTIIDHRLDRLAPWRRDRVVHGYALTGDTDGGATLQVRVVIASADLVHELTASLRASGLEPVVITTGADDPAGRPPIRFGGEQAPRRPAWQARFGRIWLSATAVLCGLAVASMLWATAVDARRVEAERHLAKARRLIREASENGSAMADPSFADKRPENATVLLIDKLAATLPDTTYLRELALTPGEVRWAGTSADAPALIPLLETAGLFDVRFTAPVSRGDDRKDAFEITADRAPPAPDAR
jgi:general secretion pathway protein L